MKPLSDTKKLTVKAMEQNCEVMLKPKDFVHITFIDREENVIIKSEGHYDLYNDANKYQIN